MDDKSNVNITQIKGLPGDYINLFIRAVQTESITEIDLLLERATPEQKAEMFAVASDHAFGRSRDWKISAITRLWLFANDPQKAAIFEKIAAGRHWAFRWAVAKGHLTLVNYLLDYATPEQKDAMFEQLAFINYAIFNGITRYGHLNVLSRLLEVYPKLEEKLISLKNKYVHRALLALKRYDKTKDAFIDHDIEQARYITDLLFKNELTEDPRNLLIESRKLEDRYILMKSGVPNNIDSILNTMHQDVAKLRNTCKNPLAALNFLGRTTIDKARSSSNAPDNKSSNASQLQGVDGKTLSFLTKLEPNDITALFGRKSIYHVERHMHLLTLMRDYSESELALEATLNVVLKYTEKSIKSKELSNKVLNIIAGNGKTDGGLLMHLYDIHGHNELLIYHNDALALYQKNKPSTSGQGVLEVDTKSNELSGLPNTGHFAIAASGTRTTINFKYQAGANGVMQATGTLPNGTAVASVDVKASAAAPLSRASSSASSTATAATSTALSSGNTGQQGPSVNAVKGMLKTKVSSISFNEMIAARLAKFTRHK